MVQATFTVSSAEEFNLDLFEKIRGLLFSNGAAGEFVISVRPAEVPSIFREETREEYFDRLRQSIADVEAGRVISFTSEEFEAFSQSPIAQSPTFWLQKLAEIGAFADIENPVEWQREIRKDRPLPGREN